MCFRCWAVSQHRDVRTLESSNGKNKEEMMREPLREAIDEEMEADPAVCVMGKTA